MLEGVTESENMDTPSDNVVILNGVHVFPGELKVVAKGEAMDVDLGRSTKHICLRAKLLSSADSPYFHGDGVDVIDLLVGEVDYHLIKTVVLSSL